MILRKPYAILIKNFRLIHFIMSLLVGYLFYKTSAILSFLTEYLDSVATTINHEVTTSLFDPTLFIAIFIIIVSSIVIMVLMKIKDKPIKFYLYNIFIHILLWIYYSVSSDIIKSLEVGLVDVRILKIINDLASMALLIQGIGLILVIIRTTGFDIKSFNFKKDLEELNIETTDNEEFEVEMQLDTDKLKRNLNKKIRHTKYIYFENKLLMDILLIIIIFVVSLGLFLYFNVYNKTYKLNDPFKTNQFIFNFENSYNIKNDNKGTVLKEGYELVVVKLNALSLYKEQKLSVGRFYLDIKGYKYYHSTKYKDRILDLGTTYTTQLIKSENSNYLLVFEVPENKIDDKMILKYTDTDSDVIKINVEPTSLNKKQEIGTYIINQEIDFKDSILGNSKLTINHSQIEKSFNIPYSYCINENCTPMLETLNPNIKDGATHLLKINGVLSLEDNNDKINTIYKFIKKFGKIKYKNGDTFKTMPISIKQVKPSKTNDSYIYIGITEDVANAEQIIIEFNIRNKIYIYSIK